MCAAAILVECKFAGKETCCPVRDLTCPSNNGLQCTVPHMKHTRLSRCTPEYPLPSPDRCSVPCPWSDYPGTWAEWREHPDKKTIKHHMAIWSLSEKSGGPKCLQRILLDASHAPRPVETVTMCVLRHIWPLLYRTHLPLQSDRISVVWQSNRWSSSSTDHRIAPSLPLPEGRLRAVTRS